MTRIDFYTNSPDRFATACRIAAKAYRQSNKVVVYAPTPESATAFDVRLWSFQQISFIPHCRANSPLAARTPVVIAATLEDVPHDDILLNLDGDLPPGFARFERVLEIVGTDPQDIQAARQRYRFYRDRGYALRNFDLSAPSADD